MHRDDGREAQGTDVTYSPEKYGARIAGALLYLNDDFEGGELKYFLGPQFKPVPGLLVVHDGEAVHGVNPVISGTRYTIGAFYVSRP
jgi:predicted 2-oxoglutarate/Fe(II)-dependent dioxygenase YbiX